MEKKKKIFFTIFSIVLLFSLSACNSDKDEASSLANSFNNWLQSFSKYAVAKDKNLQGERLTGIDSYTGNYEAKYNDFDPAFPDCVTRVAVNLEISGFCPCYKY